MRIMTYNVHSCVGMDAQLSTDRVAEVIAEAGVDVVCLQEVDVGRKRTRSVDQATSLAVALGMNCHFHPAMRISGEQYGDAILSKHPLKLVRAGTLPMVRSLVPLEPRGVLWVSVSAEGKSWQIMNTHLGLGRAERRAQAHALASLEWVGAALAEAPLVLCGDFNSRPASQVHAILGAQLRDAQKEFGGIPPKTFSTRMRFVTLDYIFLSPGIRVHRLETIDNPRTRIASDHFPLVAELSWQA
ncbi:MAG TPA: endonuclease/exonuclease/phosphatase family protein [Chthoniobacteraceae bacterium]|jgi:endonuclease/exonuclease/phosphatase family metal-dependent hydrolase